MDKENRCSHVKGQVLKIKCCKLIVENMYVYVEKGGRMYMG